MKDSLILQDKNYISARRVHELFGYTSDYVGQLCRAGKLDAKMIGRAWFVTEKSVIDYQTQLDEIAKVKGRDKKKYKKLLRRNLVENQSQPPVINESKLQIETKDQELVKNIPEIPIVEASVISTVPEYIPDLEIPLIPVVELNNIYEVVNETFEKIDTVIDNDSKFENRIEEHIISPIQIHMEEVVEEKELPFISKRAFVRLSVASGIFICALVLVFQSGVFTNNKVEVGSAAVGDGFGSKVIAFFANVFGREKLIVQKDYKAEEIAPKSDIPFNGIAVVPAADSDVQNELIKQKIRESFSDDVFVKPDQDGSSGVITPVFRKAKGDDFLYVLVPVNNNQ